jgi:ABC-type Zn2+ transport system substrate-binding protein/surface adhesin
VVGGQVDENGASVQVVDEIPSFAPGTQQTASVNLASGAYVLICNVPGHYQLGMRTGRSHPDSDADPGHAHSHGDAHACWHSRADHGHAGGTPGQRWRQPREW